MQRAAKKSYWSYQDLLQWDSPHLHKRKWRHPQHRNNPQPLATRTKSYKAMARRDAHHRRTTTMIKKTLTEARSSRFSPSLPPPSIDEALDDDMPSLILLLAPPLLGGHSRHKCGLEFPTILPTAVNRKEKTHKRRASRHETQRIAMPEARSWDQRQRHRHRHHKVMSLRKKRWQGLP